MAPIGSGPAFSAGRPREVLDIRRYIGGFAAATGDVGRPYDISPDGQRFLLIADQRRARPDERRGAVGGRAVLDVLTLSEMIVSTMITAVAPIAAPDQIIFVLGDYRGDGRMRDT